ncbi:MAG: hypothetical protein LUI02_04710, partial [Clostridiales bacterium]|nr:hypothetical protein [Clostridiales bacterium]
MTYVILIAGIFCLHLLLKMNWVTSAVIFAYLLVMLQVHRKKYAGQKMQKRRFTEVCEYLDSLLYSFAKEEKVDLALENVEAALVDGPMRERVWDALEHLHMTFDDTDVMRESLQIIEEDYPCSRIRTVHDFMVHVESYGGKIESSVNLLIADKNRWESRIMCAMKERSKMFTDIALSIVASLVICGMILYLPVMDMDISGNILCQILTGVVIVLDDMIFLKAQNYLAVDWLLVDVSAGDDELKKIEGYHNYDPKKDRILSIILALPCIAVAVFAALHGRQAVLAAALLLALVMINQHRIGRSLAKKNIVKSVKCAFPNWLMDIVLLLQSENVQMAIIKSLENAPPVLSPDLDELTQHIEMSPEAPEPYHGFLKEFEIPEVHSAMSMLFSLSMGHSSQADKQIG